MSGVNVGACITRRFPRYGLMLFHWAYDPQGRPSVVTVTQLEGDGRSVEIDNSGGAYKPCVTHCGYLLERWAGSQPANNTARRAALKSGRRQRGRPRLKVHG